MPFRKFSPFQLPLLSFVRRRLFWSPLPKRRNVGSTGLPETLEVRCLLSAVMSAALVDGQLTITDTDTTGKDNSLSVSVIGTDLVISDANEQFIAAPAGGTLSNGDKTLTIPLSLITTGLTINGAGGDDSIIVNSLSAPFSGNLALNGDGGADTVTFQTTSINVGTGSVDVAAETINVNSALTAGGAIILSSTGNDSVLTINAAMTAGADSMFTADKMVIGAAVNVGPHVLTLVPESTADANDFINLGDNLDSELNTLQLSDAELDRITATTIVIGDTKSSTISINSAIEHAGDSSFQVVTGRDIVFHLQTSWATEDGHLSFTANQAANKNQNFIGIKLDGVILSSSGNGNITLSGHGGKTGLANYGIWALDGAIVDSMGTGQITLTGVGGSGSQNDDGLQIEDVGTRISSVTGNILIQGQGGTSTTSNGMVIFNGAVIESSGTATVTLDGTGGNNDVCNGVVLSAQSAGTQIQSVNGDITITGQGGDTGFGAATRGLRILDGVVIRSTGTAKINLTGTGGDSGGSSRGLEIIGQGTRITSATGDILITGDGGDNGVAYGVWMTSGSTIESTGTAKVTIQGTGGDAGDGSGVMLESGGFNTRIISVNGDIKINGQGGNTLVGELTRGIGVFSGVLIKSTGTAKITLDGTGGDSERYSRGVEIGGTARITSVTGNIQIVGRGGDNYEAHGVAVWAGATVDSTGTAQVSIDGTGGDGPHDSRGVEIAGADTLIQTVSGNIQIIGHGGNTGFQNHGMYVSGGAVVKSTGSGEVALTGIGGTGSSANRGVHLDEEGTSITSVLGDIRITGQGGAGADSHNIGVWLVRGASVTSTGTARIFIDGTGGGTNENNGVMLNGFGNTGASRVVSKDGDISIIGHGSTSATGQGNRGFGMYQGAVVQSTGTARIIVDGTGGTGSDSARGVEMAYAGALITSVMGDIAITGHGGNNASGYGIWIVLGAVVESTGTAKVTLDGRGGDAADGNGIIVHGSGGSTRVSSVDGDITLIGHGGLTVSGATPRGVAVSIGAVVQSTGAARIILDGTGGTGSDGARGVEIGDAGTRITSALGDIAITGYGGTSAYAFGVWIRSGAVVESTGTARLTINGTGGNGFGEDVGVAVNGYGTSADTRVASLDGDIHIVGWGGNSVTNVNDRGVGIFEGSSVQSTGAARIMIDGTGGNSVAGARGVEVGDVGTRISSTTGDIQITGQGGMNETAIGVWIRSGADVVSAGTAKILIHGTAGSGNFAGGVLLNGFSTNAATRVASLDGDVSIIGDAAASTTGLHNRGVGIYEGAIVESTGLAKIAVEGTAGNGNYGERGVEIVEAGTRVSSERGDISITGHGGTASVVTQTYNTGVWIRDFAVVESTATDGVGAKITINGTAGKGSHADIGVMVSQFGRVTSHVGEIQITGQGAVDSGIFSYGVNIQTGGIVESTDTAKIDINGTAGSGTSYAMGVLVDQSARVQSTDGDIEITGQGGTSSGDANMGVAVQSSAFIESTGSGNISIDGTGGQGTSHNYGFRILGSDSWVRTADGDIQIQGVGGTGTLTFNTGVAVIGAARITATGAGSIDIDGTGGSGVFDAFYRVGQVGVWLLDSGSTISSKDGDIKIIGTGGTGGVGSDGNYGVTFQEGAIQTVAGGAADVQVTGTAGVGLGSLGIYFTRDGASAAIDTSAGSGNIELITDGLFITVGDFPASIRAGNQTVSIHPRTDGVPINVGGADAAGTLGLMDAELDRIFASGLNIGDANSGNLSVSADITRPAATNTQLSTGGDLSISGGQVNTNGGTLRLGSGAAPRGVAPTHVGIDVTATTTTLDGNLSITVNGLVAETDYTQLTVVGGINLNGATLLLSGSYIPSPGDSLIIVNNDGAETIGGTFGGFAEGAILSFNGRSLKVSYVGGSDENDVVLTVLNLPPVANDVNLSVTEDIARSGILPATDVDSPSLTYSVMTAPTHGTLTITDPATGAYTYSPDAEYNGPDSFTFQVNDGLVDSNLATVTITVEAVDDVSVAQDGSLSAIEDQPASGTLAATDIDSALLVYCIASDANYGTVTITNTATGAYTYTPNPDYNGADSFTFRANDGTSDSSIATVSIAVEAVNDAPQLNVNGGPVTFSAKAAKKGGPVTVLPNVTVVDPDQSPAFGIGGGTLTVSIDVSAKITKKGFKLHDTIGGVSNVSAIGTSTGPAFGNGKLAMSITLHASTTAAAIETFLRGVTFQTKGDGVKLPQRIMQSQLTDAGGAASNLLQQTIDVTK